MTLLFVLLAYAVFAQNDPKAKEILDKAAAKTRLPRSVLAKQWRKTAQECRPAGKIACARLLNQGYAIFHCSSKDHLKHQVTPCKPAPFSSGRFAALLAFQRRGVPPGKRSKAVLTGGIFYHTTHYLSTFCRISQTLRLVFYAIFLLICKNNSCIINLILFFYN